jgi:tRNA(Ile)-lysidine synthase
MEGRVVVLFSGGRDSTCLLDLAVSSSADVVALHVDYGSGFSEHCRAICERLGVPLTVHEAGRCPGGNFQAWARDVRYAAAARFEDRDIAVGHTATDQVETVLYRLASSPGVPQGMPARSGRIVRPLLHMTREQTAAHCEQRGLPWVEDPSNASSRYARNRIRHELLPLLREIHPAADANILRTLELLRSDEARALARLGVPPVRVDEVLALRHGSLDLGGGRRAVARYGDVTIEHPPAPVALEVPGRVAWGAGEVVASFGDDGLALDAPVEVRAWRPGDRMRPAGLGGTKSLQDLFTDRKVPREQRHRLPVVTCGGEIAWVAGVAASDRFVGGRVRLGWRP